MRALFFWVAAAALIFFPSALFAEVSFREPLVIPSVAKMDCCTTEEVRLDAAQTVTVCCAEEGAADWVKAHVTQWFLVTPKIVTEKVRADLPKEGYRLVAVPTGVRIEASGLAGVRNAMFTLRQVAERDSEGYQVSYYRMPRLTIEDSPVLAFRGVHLCWFPEFSVSYVERQIRLAAYFKFNYVVLEPWGVFRSTRHPWFGWKDAPMTKEAITRLRKAACDLGVTLVPQLNVFGHASSSRARTGKHASLDFHPKMQSLFEPGGGMTGSSRSGWNWCLSNPAARQTVQDLVIELHEAFGNPPFFHIGCDEAEEPSCASCRAQPYSQLLGRHVADVCGTLARRGARALMWHDMLLGKGDERWKGFCANGTTESVKLLDALPKDVVICDWQYGKPARDYPTLRYFSEELGRDTVTCPWNKPDGIRAQAAFAREKGLFGVLETTWHHVRGAEYGRTIQAAACGAWGRGEALNDVLYANAWRQVGWDAGVDSYSETGWYDNQVSRDILER